MELELPLEFLVHGVPISAQAKRPESRESWKNRVRISASKHVHDDVVYIIDEPVGVTIFYFPADQMQGDVDNIVKPILDALATIVYTDDRLVERVVVQRFNDAFGISDHELSGLLTPDLNGQRPVVYIRVAANPAESVTL
jgi:hypothetical protein